MVREAEGCEVLQNDCDASRTHVGNWHAAVEDHEVLQFDCDG